MIVFVKLTCGLTRCVLGTSMGNLALSYHKLGRHHDAVVLEENTLDFWRRVLPENHPHTGVM